MLIFVPFSATIPSNVLPKLISISKSFDIKPLIKKVSLGIADNDRIGIVGRNGGGKSTLIKILSGSTLPDNGKVSRSKIATFGMLNQFDSINTKTRVEIENCLTSIYELLRTRTR